MIQFPLVSTLSSSSAASDVYKRQRWAKPPGKATPRAKRPTPSDPETASSSPAPQVQASSGPDMYKQWARKARKDGRATHVAASPKPPPHEPTPEHSNALSVVPITEAQPSKARSRGIMHRWAAARESSQVVTASPLQSAASVATKSPMSVSISSMESMPSGADMSPRTHERAVDDWVNRYKKSSSALRAEVIKKEKSARTTAKRLPSMAALLRRQQQEKMAPVSYTHLRAHETPEHLVCRLLLEKKKNK
eukprot:TRINITY_DN55474_c0_g1_i1.p1 TRINITY_DN55474_c0_g1~~TRINITY_DN55474_c0_g1_i1.p1  ORF type:complete len:250 (+),score=64.17 TRINITY_DN55474_c0_g1_i1:94-843(+)